MQIVIDLPEKIYKRIAVTPRCASTFDAIEDRDAFVKAVQKGIALSKGATNGDIIQALFPNGSYGTNGNEVHVFGVGGNGIWTFTKEWWNAPYKAESEETNADSN